MRQSDSGLADLLIGEARRINSPAFIADDPVQFPRRFADRADSEIAGLLSATIAWGNRRMICRDCDRLLRLMDNQPARFTISADLDGIPDDINIHRTFFGRNLKYYLRGLRAIYRSHSSLADFARETIAPHDPTPAWTLVDALNRVLHDANPGLPADSRCLPQNTAQSALKRVNMWLRWMVRDDSIVDLGLWKGVISPRQLFIPLDVHSAATARELGLLRRKSNDRRAVEELTGVARAIIPEDPALLDFALFGIGMKL